MQPIISVIIPTKNRKRLLADAIDSVIQQSYPHWEVIVVDDGSTDDTAQLSTQYASTPNVKFVQRPDALPPGANTCRNYGLSLASGTWIKWLDSDDVLDKLCLEKQLSMVSTSTDVCFCQADYFRMSEGQRVSIPAKVWGKLKPAILSEIVQEYILRGVRWQTACGLWRKVFLPEKPFQEGLMNSQEWLMHLMMLLRKPRIQFIDESLIHVRTHTDSMSNARNKGGDYYFHQSRARVYALRELRESNMLDRSVYKKLLRTILWNHLFIAYKGKPLKGVTFFKYYPFIFASFFFSKKVVK